MEGMDKTERITEEASDMEMALSMIGYISEPVPDAQGHSTRDFYIAEAKRAMETFTDEDAKSVLQEVIQKYENPV